MDMETLLDMSKWPVWVLPTLVVGVILVLVVLYLLTQPGAPPELKQPVITKEPDRKDLRSALRRSGNPIDILVSDEQSKIAPQNGLVLDRSPRGLCLALDRPVDVGVVITVKRTNNTTPWIKVTVKNCRQVGGTYELGCEFVSVPSASTLMMFG
jgi:hypothetical protein